MPWFSNLADKAESLLNNLDEQTGAALRYHNADKVTNSRKVEVHNEPVWERLQRRRHSPVRHPSPPSHDKAYAPRSPSKLPARTTINRAVEIKEPPTRLQRSPPRKKKNFSHELSHCPADYTLDKANKDEVDLNDAVQKRRFSLPDDLDNLYKIQELQVDNTMLKNELHIMNKEVSALLDHLRSTEDDLKQTQIKVEGTDRANKELYTENNSLSKQVQELKQKMEDLINIDFVSLKDTNKNLESDLDKLRITNREMEQKLKHAESQSISTCTKLETDLKHAHNYINELQNDLEKSKNDHHVLEKDWEAYKLRVKSMLNSKDQEIKAFQNGDQYNADAKIFLDQIETLRDEKTELLEEVDKVRNEVVESRRYVEQLEARSQTAERLVNALREALKEERIAKNKVDADCLAVKQEMKMWHLETTQTINRLRTTLCEKETELNKLKDQSTTSMSPTTDSSALNVADYDIMHESIANEKVHYLTQTLVVKQGKIDLLMADNNMLRIQLEKLESKYKRDLEAYRINKQSVVNVNDVDGRMKGRNKYIPESVLSSISLRIGIFMRRNPLFRILIILYMVGLHLWVAVVLLTYTPGVNQVMRNKT